jgi:hypothetical protein
MAPGKRLILSQVNRLLFRQLWLSRMATKLPTRRRPYFDYQEVYL